MRRRLLILVFGLACVCGPAQFAPAQQTVGAPRACASGGTSPSSITTGGASQPLFGTGSGLPTASSAAVLLTVQNPLTAALQGIGAAEDLFLNYGSTAAANANSIEIQPGSSVITTSVLSTPTNPSVIAATTGHKFYCSWQPAGF